MQILIPMAGASPFFKPEDYFFPKPLIEIEGRTMIDRVIEPLLAAFPGAAFTFLVPHDDVVRFSLDATIRLVAGENANVISLRSPTKGALCSCLLAVDHLDPEQPLIISNGDQVVDADLHACVSALADDDATAGVITFESVHPRWSYVLTDSGMRVTQAAEKRVISKSAIAGFYYFRRAADFIWAASQTLKIDDHVNGFYYIAPCLNQLIIRGDKVTSHRVEASQYNSFYSPQKIDEYIEKRFRFAMKSNSGGSTRPITIVIPAAGEGSRFAKAKWRRPKPFIDVAGKSMIELVLDNVAPRGSVPLVLVRRDHFDSCASEVTALRRRGCAIQAVDGTTEGTACTVLLARAAFDTESPMLIANSDQIVDFSCSDFIEDCLNRNLDGSILVFRDKTQDPKWSFAKVNSRGLVIAVAEKNPISDLATVGIYLFRRGSDFVKAAVDMIALNERVNNEFYTCPVYNFMIRVGLKIGVYEVSPDAMHGLGTPEDLGKYLASIGALPSRDAPPVVIR